MARSAGEYRSDAGERAATIHARPRHDRTGVKTLLSAGKRHINFFHNIRLLVFLFPRGTRVLETKVGENPRRVLLMGGPAFSELFRRIFRVYFCPLRQAISALI
jgi:hypothetical protein